ncbi:MAG: SipW-dependent-type signal peptide-containing protein [Candidatus Limivicinus sp.]|nr:SipW-dependent-type signal peptide-containing protein [Candidatus Limivicinus sp.]
MKKKILVACLCVALAVLTIAGTTLAYLTSQDTVTNTFTVGNVSITLDEAKVDEMGKPVENADRVKANSYKLIPGQTYNKDPMVTVLKDSESSYIKMTVTFTKAAELDAIFAPTGATLTSIFNGYDSANWIYKGNTEDTTANTRTYEFWYKETVAAPTADVELDALFDSITVPGTITKEQLATIEGMTITVNAYAIQADGFANAEAAWAAYPAK